MKAKRSPRRPRLLHTTLALLLGAASLPLFAASTIRFRFTSHTVEETAGEAVIEVWRTGDTTTAVSADYATVEGTEARAGEDFTAIAGTLTFGPGMTNQFLRIPILNNALTEPTEAFQVHLANPSADTSLGAPATISIRDNDGIKLEFSSYRGGENTGAITLALVRGPDETAPASVDYALTPVTATPGEDFVLTNGRVEFQAGERVKLLPIPLVNDGVSEPNETFRVELSNGVGGTLLTPNAAMVTIVDNDPGVGFVQNRRWVHEDQEGVLLEVSRGNDGLLGPFTVDYTVKDGTATAGKDFTAASGTLSFAAGEMTRPLWIPVINDGVEEADQNFQVTLGNPTGGLPPGLTVSLTATVTICDATGMTPRRFRGIQAKADGAIQLDLEGGVDKRFLPFYSIFQLEESSDLQQWRFLRLVGHWNASTNPPGFTDLPAPGTAARYYRVNPTPYITPSVPPSGPHPVGITRRWITDPERRNRYHNSTNSSFMIAIWYPARPQSGTGPDRYEETSLAEDIPWQQSQWMDEAIRLASYSFLDAPAAIAAGGHPVLLHSHGLGSARYENMERNELLASHGYVVVALTHADAGIDVFPDGTLYRAPTTATSSAAGLQDRVRDMVVTLDALARMNESDPVLSGALDLGRVGVSGFSWGGVTAPEFARRDPRVKAVACLDLGALETAPELSRHGVDKPLLMLNAYNNPDTSLFGLASRDAWHLQISDTVHGNFGGYDWFNFPGSTSAREATRTINAYLLSFFNKHLKAQDDHLLDAKSPLYPRVNAFRRK